jgi:hypothetical protein
MSRPRSRSDLADDLSQPAALWTHHLDPPDAPTFGGVSWRTYLYLEGVPEDFLATSVVVHLDMFGCGWLNETVNVRIPRGKRIRQAHGDFKRNPS